jgi:hypothetical protein
MPEIRMKDIFPTPWGVLEEVKDEVIKSGFGGRGRMEFLQMQKYFLDVTQACAATGISKRWLRRKISNEVRFVMEGVKQLFLREDVMNFAEKYKKEMAEIEVLQKQKLASKPKSKKKRSPINNFKEKANA